MSPEEQARSDILSSGLSTTTIANALALLGRAHPYNGHVTLTWESLLDLWGLTNQGVARRYLGRMKQTGIIHYDTNKWAYVTFRAWPPEGETARGDYQNSAWELPKQRVGTTVFASDENPTRRVGTTKRRVGTTETARGDYQKSAHIERERERDLTLTLRDKISLNHSPDDDEQKASIAILTDPAILLSRRNAEKTAALYPFHDIRAFCTAFVDEGRKAREEAGLIVYRLEAAETIPPLVKNDLYQRHRTPDEIAADDARQAQAEEENRHWEERQADRETERQAAFDAAVQPSGRPTADAPATIWKTAQAELAASLPSATYEQFVQDTDFLSYHNGKFVIGVPHARARDWLQNRLYQRTQQILSRLDGRAVEVTFAVRPRITPANQHQEED